MTILSPPSSPGSPGPPSPRPGTATTTRTGATMRGVASTDSLASSSAPVLQDLSSRSSWFRSKLIEEFRLFENGYNEGSSVDRPTYTTTDITEDERLLHKLLRDNPHQLIKFKLFKRSIHSEKKQLDKRLTRIRNRNQLPMGVWAKAVVYNSSFQSLMMWLILLNGVLLGVQVELSQAQYWQENQLIDLINSVSLIFYVLEIVLKWTDDFRGFWKDGWNVFDFFITAMSGIPDELFGSDNNLTNAARFVRVFRTFRSFKLIVRFQNLRLIVETILVAFQSMAFILMFLAIITYIFAIFAINMFEEYTQSPADLLYKDKFADLGSACITLFQLLTLDQWYKMHQDYSKVVEPIGTAIFFILWVFIGAFIFRNVFVGVMVRNFQNISHELVKQTKAAKKRRTMRRNWKRLNNAIKQQPVAAGKAGMQTSAPVPKIPEDVVAADAQNQILWYVAHLMTEEQETTSEWDTTVHRTLAALTQTRRETVWPRDTLFQYLQTMDALQENMKEYQELQHLASLALYEFHDT